MKHAGEANGAEAEASARSTSTAGTSKTTGLNRTHYRGINATAVQARRRSRWTRAAPERSDTTELTHQSKRSEAQDSSRIPKPTSGHLRAKTHVSRGRFRKSRFHPPHDRETSKQEFLNRPLDTSERGPPLHVTSKTINLNQPLDTFSGSGPW